MSLNFKKIPVVGRIDPRIDLAQPVAYTATHTSQNLRYQRTAFQSFGTSGNWTTTINVPSTSTIVDRVVFAECDMLFTFVGADNGSLLVVPGDGFDALRSLPLQSCMSSSAINLGDLSFSETVSRVVKEKYQMVHREHLSKHFSTSPAQKDFYQNYNDSVTFGDALNPLASIGNSDLGISRGGFDYTIVSSTNTQTVVQVKWLEPLMMAPFSPANAYDTEKGFVGINNITLDFVMSGNNLTNMWSHSSGGNPLTSVTVAFNNPPAIVCTFLDSNPLVQAIPKSVAYNIPEVAVRQSASAVLANGATATFSIPSISLNSVPEAIVIVCKEIESAKTYLSSDTYAEISNLSLTWDTRSSLLNDATQQQLYQLAVKNGSQMSYSAFKKYTGSMLIIRPDDIGLSLNKVAGSLDKTSIQIDCVCTNISGASKTYNLQMMVLYNSVLTKPADGIYSKTTGILSTQDVLNATVHHGRAGDAEGAGLFSSLGALVKPFAIPLAKMAGKQVCKALGNGRKAPVRRRKRMTGRGKVNKRKLDAYLQDYLDDN